ncbi:MAG: hypothetical protein H6810_06170 [Phycisphaeraceae bacterium]|nr:MAG: hypothetical protein H6810_06170 [Phycisphaeraceae bacterium]
MPRDFACLVVVLGLLVSTAFGQRLRESQVLVVYDSRVADSVAVAEHYAGSAKVPGGSGGEAGVRPGVLVFDIASAGITINATNGTILYPDYKAQVRDPIRSHLESNNLVYRVRSLVLCKGLPHRIDDPDNVGIGDQPSSFGTLWAQKRAISASVDSELVMLWQDLDETAVDAFHVANAGYIRSPYWRKSEPINNWSSRFIRVQKAWAYLTNGNALRTVSEDPAELITPGDMMLVCRLDGNSVADVNAMVDRAQHLVYDVDNSGFVLDESDSNGIADPSNNNELDNVIDAISRDDDYEVTRDVVLADGRFDPAKMHYDAERTVAHFIVGPNVDFGGQGLVVTDPLILLTSYGLNHTGRPSTNVDMYEESFNLRPGAIFNTLESFNGRQFNGLGTRYSQGQVADFISSGGTFGIGMVWEPFAQSVTDSNRLVRNFVLGRLSWAEAAYTAIPCISWQHVVVGDPLAIAHLSCDDINGDGVFDVEDLYAWEQNPVDINRDGVADDVDRQLLIDGVRVPEQQTNEAGRDLMSLLRKSE